MKLLFILLTTVMLSSTAYGAELNITDAPESDVATITFEVPDTVPENWFPLRDASEYLPMEVSWNEIERAVVIDSEPMAVNWKWLTHQELFVEQIDRHKDLMIVDGVTYCSPYFLASRLMGVGFVHDGELWYCDVPLDFDGHVKTAMLQLQVVVPDEYAFVKQYLPGGVKIADEYTPDALSYVYPYEAYPICYVCDTTLIGEELAATIAHEAWHVYQVRSGLVTNEQGAIEYETKILNALLRELRIRNGTSWMAEA